MKPALIIFIKNPIPGHCKTRLAKSIGDEKALAIYRQLLRHTRKIATLNNIKTYLYYDSFIDEQDDWSNKQFEKRLQSSGDLGQRMHAAFEEILSLHKTAVIIGSDCPELTSEDLRMAFDLLGDYDCCIGPSYDGGYYLLGLKTLPSAFFKDIEWSTENVMLQTLLKMKNAGLRYRKLRMLSDLDDASDLERFPDYYID